MHISYNLLKFIHVAAVIIWVGGLVALSVVNVRLARAGDRAVLASLVQQTVFYGRAVIGPAAVVVVLAGIGMVVQSGLHMRTLWIEWGLFVVFLVFFFGGVFAARHGAELSKLVSTAPADDQRVVALQRRLRLLSAVTLVLLFSVVWAMVFKPTL